VSYRDSSGDIRDSSTGVKDSSGDVRDSSTVVEDSSSDVRDSSSGVKDSCSDIREGSDGLGCMCAGHTVGPAWGASSSGGPQETLLPGFMPCLCCTVCRIKP
jgi:hypothetical protein